MNVHTTPSSNVTVTVEPRSMVTSLTDGVFSDGVFSDGVFSDGVFSDVSLVPVMSIRGYACINASSTTVTITTTMMRPL